MRWVNGSGFQIVQVFNLVSHRSNIAMSVGPLGLHVVFYFLTNTDRCPITLQWLKILIIKTSGVNLSTTWGGAVLAGPAGANTHRRWPADAHQSCLVTWLQFFKKSIFHIQSSRLVVWSQLLLMTQLLQHLLFIRLLVTATHFCCIITKHIQIPVSQIEGKINKKIEKRCCSSKWRGILNLLTPLGMHCLLYIHVAKCLTFIKFD